jgi:hypothetical protein
MSKIIELHFVKFKLKQILTNTLSFLQDFLILYTHYFKKEDQSKQLLCRHWLNREVFSALHCGAEALALCYSLLSKDFNYAQINFDSFLQLYLFVRNLCKLKRDVAKGKKTEIAFILI